MSASPPESPWHLSETYKALITLAAEAYGGAPVICSTGLSCAANADGTQTAAFDSARRCLEDRIRRHRGL